MPATFPLVDIIVLAFAGLVVVQIISKVLRLPITVLVLLAFSVFLGGEWRNVIVPFGMPVVFGDGTGGEFGVTRLRPPATGCRRGVMAFRRRAPARDREQACTSKRA